MSEKDFKKLLVLFTLVAVMCGCCLGGVLFRAIDLLMVAK